MGCWRRPNILHSRSSESISPEATTPAMDAKNLILSVEAIPLRFLALLKLDNEQAEAWAITSFWILKVQMTNVFYQSLQNPNYLRKIRRKYCNSEHAAPARSVTHCIALKNSATVTAADRRSLTPDKSGRSRTSSATVAEKQRLAPELIPISLTRTIVLASGRVVFQVGNFKGTKLCFFNHHSVPIRFCHFCARFIQPECNFFDPDCSSIKSNAGHKRHHKIRECEINSGRLGKNSNFCNLVGWLLQRRLRHWLRPR